LSSKKAWLTDHVIWNLLASKVLMHFILQSQKNQTQIAF